MKNLGTDAAILRLRCSPAPSPPGLGRLLFWVTVVVVEDSTLFSFPKVVVSGEHTAHDAAIVHRQFAVALFVLAEYVLDILLFRHGYRVGRDLALSSNAWTTFKVVLSTTTLSSLMPTSGCSR